MKRMWISFLILVVAVALVVAGYQGVMDWNGALARA